MTKGGLYTGFECYRILTDSDIENALKRGIVAFDANILLNLYRYNARTVDDLLNLAEALSDRLFIPNQVIREFWRNRQSVISNIDETFKQADNKFTKGLTSIIEAINILAKGTALQTGLRDSFKQEVESSCQDAYKRAKEAAAQLSAFKHTREDALLARLETLLNGVVGNALTEEEWKRAVEEGERRVEHSIPPGYMDVKKLESDLPERASGDYIVWHQLLIEGSERKTDLILVTADTKEDWWNYAPGRRKNIGARHELIEEYLQATGCRFFLLEPTDLLKYSKALGVTTTLESVQDIERVRDEEESDSPWTLDAVRAVLKELEAKGHTQAAVIREAIKNGGRITRQRVYELDNRDESQMLRGFTRPVKRITAELQETGTVPYGVPPLLDAVYEDGVKSSHFAVPFEVAGLIEEENPK